MELKTYRPLYRNIDVAWSVPVLLREYLGPSFKLKHGFLIILEVLVHCVKDIFLSNFSYITLVPLNNVDVSLIK
jgi:hypothetical protein